MKKRSSSVPVSKKEQSDKLIVSARNLISTDIKKSFRLANEALQLAQEISYQKGEADALRTIGINYDAQNKLGKALEMYKKAMPFYIALGDKQGEAMLYNNFGIIDFKHAKYISAMNYYFQSLKIKEDLGDLRGVCSSFTNIGSVYQRQNNHKTATKFYKKALIISKKIQDVFLTAALYQNIGSSLINQRKFKEALLILHEAVVFLSSKKQTNALAYVYNNIGSVLKAQKKYKEAIAAFEKCASISRKENIQMELCNAYTNVGEVYIKLNNLPAAEKYFSLVFDMQKKKLVGSSAHLFGLMAELHKRKKDYKAAFIFSKRHAEETRKFLSKENSHQVNEIHAKYDVEKKEKETEIYRLKNIELKIVLGKLDEEKKRSDTLLKNILPNDIAEDLKATGKSPVRFFESVTVMFIDIKDFTLYSQKISPEELVMELDYCFMKFDEIIDKYKLEKIKTIGDAYLCAGGLPKPSKDHAYKISLAAIDIKRFIEERKQEKDRKNQFGFEVRIGIHTGQVIAGIIGKKKFAYDIWGDTVNTAARMEQSSEAGKINISESTFKLIQRKFSCTYRGKIPAKNKGEIDMYFVND